MILIHEGLVLLHNIFVIEHTGVAQHMAFAIGLQSFFLMSLQRLVLDDILNVRHLGFLPGHSLL